MMKVRIAAVMAGVVVVAGCSSVEAGQPTAPPGVSTSESASPPESSTRPSEDNTYGAPRVTVALDASRFLPRPCDVLTPTQMKTFGISKPGEPTTTGAIAEKVGPFCTWTADREVDSTVGVGFIAGNKHGLSDIYRGRSRFKYFDETSVNGYPAVFADTVDSRAQGVCDIIVGISDNLAYHALEEGGRKGQGSCDRAKQVAAAVIATLKG
jgi:hypothetical protein